MCLCAMFKSLSSVDEPYVCEVYADIFCLMSAQCMNVCKVYESRQNHMSAKCMNVAKSDVCEVICLQLVRMSANSDVCEVICLRSLCMSAKSMHVCEV